MGMVQDPEEMAMMMGAQNRPRVAQHAQAGPIPPQASASPIRAPKDKAMGFLGKFGRILAGGAYGGENMGWIERLGRGPEGMNAVRDEIRAGKKTAEEEARRQQMLQQFAGMEGLTPQQQMLIRNGFGVEQLAEQQFATPAAAKFGLDLKEVTDPVTGEKRLVQASEAGGVRAVEGFVPAPPAMEGFTLGEGQIRYNADGTVAARGPAKPAGGGSSSYGLNVIYGRDKNGNRVALQANSAGGINQADLPEGVTLEDEFSKSYDRTAGKGAAEKEMYQTTAGMGVLAAEEGFNRVSKQIDDAIAMSDGANTGLIMGNAPAPNLQGLLDTIGANTAFESLVALKAQGGTLGALSDAELSLLMSKVANLKRSQSQEQLDANLEILKIAMQNSMMRIKQAYETGYQSGEFGRASAVPSAASSGARAGPSGQTPPPAGFTIID
jgi:hypothetical protein